MPVLTKKRPDTLNPGQRRTLADMPQWRAEQETMRRLQNELEAIERQIREGEGTVFVTEPTSQEGKISAYAAGLLARLTGQPEPAPLSQADLTSLAEKRQAITRLIDQQGHKLDQLRGELSNEVYKDYEQEHREKRAAIVHAALVLADAWRENTAFVQTMHQAGALTAPQFALLANFSAAPLLPKALLNMHPEAFRQANANLLD